MGDGMKKHLVTMHCGQQMPASGPEQLFCNGKCASYFVSPITRASQRGRKGGVGKVQRVTPYLCGLSSDDPAWNSAKRYLTKRGYVVLYVYDPVLKRCFQRLEHIVIWEKVHGERLAKGWVIHHMNEQPDDNDLANLVALPRSLHKELHVQLRHLASLCSGIEYLKQRHALTMEYIKRSTKLADLRRIWFSAEKGE